MHYNIIFTFWIYIFVERWKFISIDMWIYLSWEVIMEICYRKSLNTKYKGVIWSSILTYLSKLLSYCNIMYMEPLFCSTQHWVPIIIVTFTKMKMSLKLLYCRELFYNLLQYIYSSYITTLYALLCILLYYTIEHRQIIIAVPST